MLRQGPVPRPLHGLIEYLAAALFIVAPFIFGFTSGAATAISIVVGVVVLFVAATTDGPTSLVNQIPVPAHVVLDYLLAGFLIATPFIFGFSNESNPTAFFIGLGVVHLLLTIATRFVPGEAGGRGDGRGRRAPVEGEGGGRAAAAAVPGAGTSPGEQEPGPAPADDRAPGR